MTFAERTFYEMLGHNKKKKRTGQLDMIKHYESISKEEGHQMEDSNRFLPDGGQQSQAPILSGPLLLFGSFIMLLEITSFTIFYPFRILSTSTVKGVIVLALCLFFTGQVVTAAIVVGRRRRRVATATICPTYSGRRLKVIVAILGPSIGSALAQSLLLVLSMHYHISAVQSIYGALAVALIGCSSAMNGSIAVLIASSFNCTEEDEYGTL